MWTNDFTTRQAPDALRRKISRPQINEFPLRSWEGDVRLVTTSEEACDAFSELSALRVVGFDTETRPAFRRGQYYLPSLIQFATDVRAWVFQLDRIDDDERVGAFLAKATPLKVGVSIVDDVAELRERRDFEPAGFLDLGDVARQAGMQTRGLRNLAANLLGFRISKSLQTSNWARRDLAEKQIRYAATDAWVGYLLFQRMREAGILADQSSS